MKKKYTWIIPLVVASVVVAVLTGLYLNARESADQQNTAEMQRRETTGEKDTDEKIEEAPEINKKSDKAPAASNPGRYIDYSSDIIAQTSGTKVLFFHAPWCPQCRMLEADIKQTALPDNLTIIKVDYDSNQTLRQKYGVTLQTTLIKVDDKGNLLKKYVAYNEPTYEAVKENLLDS